MKRRKSNLEDEHQKSLIDWAKVCRLPEAAHIEPGAKLADYIFHIPNGGKRGKVEAAILKGMGTKRVCLIFFYLSPSMANRAYGLK